MTLTYPEFDARGERNLPSLFLETSSLPRGRRRGRCVRRRGGTGARRGRSRSATRALLDYLRERTASVSPTALESFLQCPFQYFARGLLRLQRPPPRPEKRLDFLTQGEIVHQVLARWWKDGGTSRRCSRRSSQEIAAQEHIPVCVPDRAGAQRDARRSAQVRARRVWTARRFAESRTELEFEYRAGPSR